MAGWIEWLFGWGSEVLQRNKRFHVIFARRVTRAVEPKRKTRAVAARRTNRSVELKRKTRVVAPKRVTRVVVTRAEILA